MQKLINWCKRWGMALSTLFLLAFIPLYPKLPLLDITHTWVYIRVEDFLVLFILLCWGILVAQRKYTLKTPLTQPILIFWLVGVVATLQGILLIFPTVADIFPNVAFLSLLRRIEYMSLFFVAYSSVKDKRFLSFVIFVLTLTVLAVSLYGIGQKYSGLPAFLTMNEEVAKGVAITLSPLSRVSSTFGGHYDLAAYFVLVLPIIVSLIFGYRNWLLRVFLGAVVVLSVFVLMMTVSRISVFGLVVALGLVIFFQKRRLVLISIPIAVIGVIVFSIYSPSLVQRFGKTLTEIDVLVDAKTGDAIGHVKEVPNDYFANKVVRQQFSRTIDDISVAASPSAAFVIPYQLLPEKEILLVDPITPTGEDLPSGTGYINLTLSPVVKRLGNFFYEPKLKSATSSADVFVINGQYLMKKALAYDMSFTTRFQGEWPNALVAFKRNVLLGSGYGSASLAVDNSYLRMLAETGVLGVVSFFAIFLIVGLYLKYTLPLIDSMPVKSFVLGFAAGVVGLGINGLFIDVFEASKVAFTLWLLMGVVVGVLRLYKPTPPNAMQEIVKAATSTYAVIAYLLIATVMLFSPIVTNYFVGDDFTWFRWAAAIPDIGTIGRYFTESQGFFYRPGTKLYFLFMYHVFWLNPTAYHVVSLILHFMVSVLVFFLAKKIFRSRVLSTLSALLFLALSGFSEAVYWISATGFLFTSFFTLMSLFSYIAWLEQKKKIYFVATISFSILSLLFHELGVVTPFVCLLYQWTIGGETFDLRKAWNTIYIRLLLLPLPVYALVRYLSQSHWLSGDYNYNVFKLPFNALGNILGYFFLTFLGPSGMPVYTIARSALRDYMLLILIMSIGAGYVGFQLVRKSIQMMKRDVRVTMLFAVGFSVISLLPFLGLGNIASRYGYLASIGFVFLIVFVIRQLYVFVRNNDRDIALISMSIIVGIFGLYQIVQLQKLQSDWHESGEEVRRFVVAMESAYDDYWKTMPMEFHFVNVPIRHGEAWVFPVGLSDALWFVFRNPDAKVYMWPDTTSAFNAVEFDSKVQKVFEFARDGTVTEMKKPPPSTQ